MEAAQKRNKADKPVIGISIGDINGIGPEVIIKALADQRVLDHVTPVVFGSAKVLSYYRKLLKFDDFHFTQIKNIDELSPKKVNVINCWNELVEIKTGQVTKEAGNCAYLALREAINYLKEDKIDAIVTAPINKKNIQRPDFNFVGHTDFVSEELGTKENLMLMVAEELRVGVVTAHVPIGEVSAGLSKETIESKLNILLNTLKKDFGINKPRVALLGLNPHAGEEGLLGREEQDIISPLIKDYKDRGHLVFGPFPADGFFGTMQQKKFDAILAMYHDQGLIPFKMLAFEHGVNFTAGIPKVRTSPDHGTAYGIAGKNEADPLSMREAIYLASNTVKIRNMNEGND
ncbi:MAG: 4-hydroxythreonine-4-phosphate dehydrogenase PdxA [Cyclobacteriaceae bacterium]|nr:4-hydroxythreonine-4-phosphate dehydrogenase PdxA [Cyclobacteriaceae bacterium]